MTIDPLSERGGGQRKGLARLQWWLVSVPIYVKILGIGLLITALFTGVAFQQIRSRVLQAHYQVNGEMAFSVAVSLAVRLESLGTVQKAVLNREINQTIAAFPNVRYIVVQDRNRNILSHGFTFPKEAPQDLLRDGGDLCASCHSPLSPTLLPRDLLEIPSKVHLPTDSLRAYRRSAGLILDVTVPIGDGHAGSVRLGVGSKKLKQDMASVNSSILMGLVLCLLASVCSALAVSYVLNRPIQALLRATRLVGRGDFSARASVFSDDEIGRLAVAFNYVAEGLADSRQRVLRADRLASIGEFAAGAAHEINNPLDGVMSCLARLQRDPANLSQNMEYLEMIQHALKRVSGVIQRLLEYSQMGEIDIRPEDIHAVIENVVAFVRVMARRESIAIDFVFGDDVPLVAGDRHRLEQALLNLALNAVAAMPEGGTLTFRTSFDKTDAGPRVEVGVSDTGVGIDSTNLARIFDPFFTTKEPGKGTGLGLAIVKEIVESHQGDITVESKAGAGTTFRIFLPAAPPRDGTETPPNS